MKKRRINPRHYLGPFWSQVLTLFSGSFFAQGLGVLLLPVLSRLYPPEAYGLFGLFVAVVATSVVLINGGYEMAIMLPEKQTEADRLLQLSLWLAAAGALMLAAIAWMFGPELLTWGMVTELFGWHLLLPVSLWMEGSLQALNYALNRAQKYRSMAAARIWRSCLTVGVSLALGFAHWGFEGLILGYLAGQLAALMVYLLAYSVAAPPLRTWLQPLHPELWQHARRYRDFPRYSILGNWLNTASKHVPFFLLPSLFNQHIAGQFTKADKVLNLPTVLVSMSVGQVFFARASQAHRENPAALAQLTRQTAIRLFLLALPFLAVILVWGPDLFAWVLGDNWRLAGEYARCLMPWMFLVFIASPLSFLVDIRRKLGLYMLYNLALFVVRLLALWLGARYFDDLGTMWVFGAAGACMVALQLAYLLYLGGVWSVPTGTMED